MCLISAFLWFWLSFYDLNTENDHGIYLSVSEVSLSKDNSKSHINIKIFLDDFENILRLYNNGKLSSTDICAKESLILSYFTKNMPIKINDKFIKLQWSGCEKIGDSLALQFSFNNPSDGKELKIKATFFTELFPSQQNIIQIKNLGASDRFLKFKEGDSWQTVSFSGK
jgi:hypothetical protein